MSGHHSARSETVEWLTPKELIDALGPFDLDPCAPAERPWPTAKVHYALPQDGLVKKWRGLVWLNPPYNGNQWEWLAKLARHGEGLALIFARTETRGFVDTVWRHADALLFLSGRLHFCNAVGRKARMDAGAPSVLVAYGREACARLVASDLPGAFVLLWHNQPLRQARAIGQQELLGGVER
ncbi:MAG: adenine methyltransferase [Patescibacteria group bacterium]|nr:adenine methyltransferase [Patescibacteria group bacterium]